MNFFWPKVETLRVCSICYKGFPDSNFFLNSNKRPQAACKTCYMARAKAWKHANKERVRELQRNARQAAKAKRNTDSLPSTTINP